MSRSGADADPTRVTRSLRSRRPSSVEPEAVLTPKKTTRSALSVISEDNPKDSKSKLSLLQKGNETPGTPTRVRTRRSSILIENTTPPDEIMLKTPVRRATRKASLSESTPVNSPARRTRRKSDLQEEETQIKSLSNIKSEPMPIQEEEDDNVIEAENIHGKDKSLMELTEKCVTRSQSKSPITSDPSGQKASNEKQDEALKSARKLSSKSEETCLDNISLQTSIISIYDTDETQESAKKTEKTVKLRALSGDGNSLSSYPRTPLPEKLKNQRESSPDANESMEIFTPKKLSKDSEKSISANDDDQDLFGTHEVDLLQPKTPRGNLLPDSNVPTSTPLMGTKTSTITDQNTSNLRRVSDVIPETSSSAEKANKTDKIEDSIHETDKTLSMCESLNNSNEAVVEKSNRSPNVSASKGNQVQSPVLLKSATKSPMNKSDGHLQSASRKESSKDESLTVTEIDGEKKKVLHTSFSKSWSQPVKGRVSDSSKQSFIDGFEINRSQNEKKEIHIKDSGKTKSKKKTKPIESDDEEDEENEEERNEFLDDEAMENDEDSMDSSEREYLEQNKIPCDGESIGSQDTMEGSENELDNDDADSFVVSDDEKYQYSADTDEDDLLLKKSPNKKSKKRRRIIEYTSGEEDSTNADKKSENINGNVGKTFANLSIEENIMDKKLDETGNKSLSNKSISVEKTDTDILNIEHQIKKLCDIGQNNAVVKLLRQTISQEKPLDGNDRSSQNLDAIQEGAEKIQNENLQDVEAMEVDVSFTQSSRIKSNDNQENVNRKVEAMEVDESSVQASPTKLNSSRKQGKSKTSVLKLDTSDMEETKIMSTSLPLDSSRRLSKDKSLQNYTKRHQGNSGITPDSSSNVDHPKDDQSNAEPNLQNSSFNKSTASEQIQNSCDEEKTATDKHSKRSTTIKQNLSKSFIEDASEHSSNNKSPQKSIWHEIHVEEEYTENASSRNDLGIEDLAIKNSCDEEKTATDKHSRRSTTTKQNVSKCFIEDASEHSSDDKSPQKSMLHKFHVEGKLKNARETKTLESTENCSSTNDLAMEDSENDGNNSDGKDSNDDNKDSGNEEEYSLRFHASEIERLPDSNDKLSRRESLNDTLNKLLNARKLKSSEGTNNSLLGKKQTDCQNENTPSDQDENQVNEMHVSKAEIKRMSLSERFINTSINPMEKVDKNRSDSDEQKYDNGEAMNESDAESENSVFEDRFAHESKSTKIRSRLSKSVSLETKNPICESMNSSLSVIDENKKKFKRDKQSSEKQKTDNLSHVMQRCHYFLDKINAEKTVKKLNTNKKAKKPKDKNLKKKKADDEAEDSFISNLDGNEPDFAANVNYGSDMESQHVKIPTKKSKMKKTKESNKKPTDLKHILPLDELSNKKSGKRLPANILSALEDNVESTKKANKKESRKKKSEDVFENPGKNQNLTANKEEERQQLYRQLFSEQSAFEVHQQRTETKFNTLSNRKNKRKMSEVDSVSQLPVLKKQKLSKAPITTSSGPFTECPVTPESKKYQKGFKESPVTPKPIGFKVRNILCAGQIEPPSVDKTFKRAKKKLYLPEPTNVLPRTEWTSSGPFLVDEIQSERIASTSTEFIVTPLETKKYKLTHSNNWITPLGAFTPAQNFKEKAQFSDRIKRESSKKLLQRKEKQKVFNKM